MDVKKVNCGVCQDELWVCERHPDRAWNEKLVGGCECGAGSPCKACNASDGPDDPPRMPPGFQEHPTTTH